MEGNKITFFVCSVMDNIETIFLGLVITPQGVMENMTKIQEVFQTMYS